MSRPSILKPELQSKINANREQSIFKNAYSGVINNYNNLSATEQAIYRRKLNENYQNAVNNLGKVPANELANTKARVNEYRNQLRAISEHGKDKSSLLENIYNTASVTDLTNKNSLPRQMATGIYEAAAKPIVSNVKAMNKDKYNKSYEGLNQLNELYRQGIVTEDELKQAFRQTTPGSMIGQDRLTTDKNGIRKANTAESTLNFAGQTLDAGGTAASFGIPSASALKNVSRGARTAATLGADSVATVSSIAGQAMKDELTPESALLQIGMTGLGNIGNVAGRGVSRAANRAYHNTNMIPQTKVTPNAGVGKTMLDKTNQVANGEPITEPFNFGRVSNERLNQHNQIQSDTGKDFVNNPEVTVYPNAHNTHVQKRIIDEGLSPEQYRDVALNAVHGRSTKLSDGGRFGERNVSYNNPDYPSGRALLGQFNDGLSLKSVIPESPNRINARIKNSQVEPGTPLAANQTGGVTVFTDLGEATPQGTRVDTIPNSPQKVNNTTEPNLAQNQLLPEPEVIPDESLIPINPKDTEIVSNPTTGELSARTKLADGTTLVETIDANGNLVTRSVDRGESAV